ncbi:MAG: DUF192 domain-containing protein [Sinobacteraceae bacterium]|nr:DUF192 domain-containing protein [Nevskiaceae bacterium]
MLNVFLRNVLLGNIPRVTPLARGASFRRGASWLTIATIVFLALGTPLELRGQSAPIEELANFPRATLDISSGKHRKAHYDIWIADTPARDEQGLMFVRELPVDQAMLFPQDPPHEMRMWMKNTFIELDMVFVGPDGHISRIVEHAVPHSLETIDSGGPVAAVLEIKGGEAQRLGLQVGDSVIWQRTR